MFLQAFKMVRNCQTLSKKKQKHSKKSKSTKNHQKSFEGVCVNYRHPGPRRVWKGGSAAHPPPPFRWNRRNHRNCRTNSWRIPGGHELLVKNTILGTKIRKMGNKNNKKTKIHERGPGKSSWSKTQMDRNLFSPGICSDHQFESILLQYIIWKNPPAPSGPPGWEGEWKYTYLTDKGTGSAIKWKIEDTRRHMGKTWQT